MRDEEYFAIKERAAAQLLKLPHVNAVGIGGRERNGQPTGEVVIKVFVTRKKPAHEVTPEELIPESFEGVATDVVEMGPISLAQTPGTANPNQPLELTRFDPLRGGIGIVVEENGGGTLGCLLRDKNDATAVYALTNHHVVVEKRFSLSRRATHPYDLAHFVIADTIGIVAAGFDDAKGDAAIIRLNPNQQWVPAIEGIGPVKGMHHVTVKEATPHNYEVRKRGINTRLTGGVVQSVGVSAGAAAGGVKHSNDVIVRVNKDPTQPNSLRFFGGLGDSGSAVVNAADEVVGVLWAVINVPDKDGFTHGVVSPIKDVLEHFKQRDSLDLMIAVGTQETVLVPAGAPTMSGPDILKKGDHRYYRPLTGGSQIMAEPMLGAVNSTTLGCIVTEVGNPNTAYVLTSYSGVSAHGTLPPTTDTDIGQPDNRHSLSGCCSNTFAEFFKGGPDHSAPTAAIVKLKEDQKWLAEIMQIGLITGIADVTALDVSSGTFQVRKRGPETRLTGGVITAIGGVHGTLPAGVRPEAMIIRPNPNTLRPGQPIHFSQLVDRGAVIVNSLNEVVGLLYDEVMIPDANGFELFHGVATPIRIVLDQLKTTLGVQLEVATTTKIDQVRTTSNRVITPDRSRIPGMVPPRRRPAAAPDIAVADLDPTGAVGELEEILAQSTLGRLVIAMWGEHHHEIRHLINHNRKVATVWHRSGGPALLQALVRGFHSPLLTVPATLNGQPTSACLDRLTHILCKYGSPRLQTDMAHIRPMLPPLGGLSFSEILAAFSRS